MKKFKYIMMLSIATFMFGCVEDIPSGSLETYPTFYFEGDDVITLAPGESYVEPGVTALEGETALDVSVVVTSRFKGYSGTTVDSEPDYYYVIYTATTSKGFSNSASRTVIVPPPTGDLVTSISGRYNSTVVRTSNGETYPGIDVWIWPTGVTNEYEISGTIGHFYADGRQYGDLYLGVGGKITLVGGDANTVTTTSSLHPGFGINTTITPATWSVDPVAKTIDYTAQGNFANSEFVVSMVQK